MRKILFTILLGLLTIGSYAQEIDTSVKTSEIKTLIMNHIYYKDPNPTWQEDADKVNIFVKNILSKEYKEAEKDKLRADAFELLYENTQCMFEDMVDVRRMAKRRAMCYLAIALLSDNYRYAAFIEDARNNLSGLQYMDKYKALIDIVELLMILDDDTNYSSEKNRRISDYVTSFNEMKPEIEDNAFVNDVMNLFKINEK